MNVKPVLLIHGGAWAMPDDAVDAHEEGIANALAAGYALLEQGASAVDAVEAAVAVMEDDETFDAGRGSFLTQDGRVQMDALLMNGENLRTGRARVHQQETIAVRPQVTTGGGRAYIAIARCQNGRRRIARIPQLPA